MCVCVHTYTCTHAQRSCKCTCSYTCLDMCMSGSCGPASGISAQDSILLVFETQFFLTGNSQIQLGWVMSRRDPPISTFPCCGYKCLLLHLSSCTDVRGGTRVFMLTCTPPTDLSPHTTAHPSYNLHRVLHSLTTQRLVLREQVQ